LNFSREPSTSALPAARYCIDLSSLKSEEQLLASGNAEGARPPLPEEPSNSLPVLQPPRKSPWTVSRSSRKSSITPRRRK
jgi:hypothetical protein